MARIYKKGREISDARVAANSLVLDTNELVSSVGGFVVKSTIAATTPKIIGISKTAATFASDNQTVAGDKAVYVTAADDLRVELVTTTTIEDSNVGEIYDIDASQEAVSDAVGTQIELMEKLGDYLGSFKILS